MKYLFWCEFPDQCDWNKLNEWLEELDMNITTYVTCKSLDDYNSWKQKISQISSRIEVNVWPTLSFEEGYWFSSQTKKESIDKLDQFKGLKIKIDIEPPIYPKGYTLGSLHMLPTMFISGKNKKYLQNKILELSKTTDIILSTGPIPRFMLNNWGFVESESLEYNYMFYTSFLPKLIRPLYRLYYKWFMKNKLNSYFAVGLIGTGIFKNEPVYKDISELKQDLDFLKQNGANKVIVFRLGSIVERGKEWLSLFS